MGNTVPLPDCLSELEGVWQGTGGGATYYFSFARGGDFHYVSRAAGSSKEIRMTIGKWNLKSSPKTFRAMSTFKLNVEPIKEGDTWTCTIDGHKLIKMSN